MADYVSGLNRVICRVTNRALTAVGPGPISTCLELSTVRRLNGAGEWRATFPDNDPCTSLLEIKSRCAKWYVDGVHVLTGIVEQSDLALNESGERLLAVSGRDLLGELSETPLGFFEAGAAAHGGPGHQIPGSILNTASLYDSVSTWTDVDVYGDEPGATESAAVASFAGESALQALITVADHIGEHFRSRKDGTRYLEWMGTQTPASGVRAVGTAGDLATALPRPDVANPHITYIQSFGVERDGYELITEIFPYGTGQGAARLAIYGHTRSDPTGYLSTNTSIQNTAAASALGKNIGKYVEFKDIRPLSNTTADLVSAKNQLYDAAMAYLERNSGDEDVVTSYRLSVTHVPEALDVGTTVRVVYTDDVYSVNADLVVLEIRSRWGAGGAESHELVVAPIVRKPKGDGDIVAERLAEGKVFQAHPQTNVSSYTDTTRLYVGYDQNNARAELNFWFGDEVVQLERVLLRFSLGPMVSATQTVAAASTSSGASSVSTTSSGGSTTPTTSDGGSSTPTSEQADGTVNHAHALEVAMTDVNVGYPLYFDGSFGLSINNGLSGSTDGGTTTLTSVQHTHDVEIPSHNHTVSVPAHQHGMEHTHTFTPNLTTDYGVFKADAIDTYIISDLEYSINGSAYAPLSGATSYDGGSWYSLDLTASLYDANFRPINTKNTLIIRRAFTAGIGSAMLDASLCVRQIIQGNYLS